MSRYSRLIARALAARYGLDDDYIEHVFMYSPLLDIGKIAIPVEILLMPSKLTDEELKTSDLVVVLTDHPNVDYDRVVKVGPRVFDTRNATKDVALDREKIKTL